MHYSGVWDSEAILQHPDWGAINADGKTNGNATSFWSPYADRLLIPQLRELAGDLRRGRRLDRRRMLGVGAGLRRAGA